jgi:hypothetical protein
MIAVLSGGSAGDRMGPVGSFRATVMDRNASPPSPGLKGHNAMMRRVNEAHIPQLKDFDGAG